MRSIHAFQFSSVAQSCPTLCNPMDCSTPGFSVHHQSFLSINYQINSTCYQIFNSVQFSPSVVSDSLRPHKSQHARPPCPSPAPGVYSNSCPLLVMPSSHLILCRPLLLLPSIIPSIKLFSNESVGQSIGVSASASVLPMNTQD